MKKVEVWTLVVTALSAIVPALATIIADYSRSNRGDAPPQTVIMEPISISDPAASLALSGATVSFSLSVGGEDVGALRIARTTISNAGTAYPFTGRPGDVMRGRWVEAFLITGRSSDWFRKVVRRLATSPDLTIRWTKPRRTPTVRDAKRC